MSSIFSNIVRVSISRINLKTAIASRRIHYNHGIPGIPVDGKVVQLNNSNKGSQIYLVGTFHNSIGCANTVKKVINHVRPDSVAIELCKRRAKLISQGHVNPLSCMDMAVAMEESSRVGAECFFIDQDVDVMLAGLNNLFSSNESIRRSYDKAVHERNKLLKRMNYTRAFWREYDSILKEACPECDKLLIENRDKLMFTRLREMEGKLIVAVVGLGHMDGIELLWKRAEGDDDVQPLGATSETIIYL